MPIFKPNYLNLEYFFNWIYRFFADAHLGALPPELIFWLKVISFFLIIVFGIMVATLVVRIINLRRDEIRDFLNLLRTDTSSQAIHNQRWDKVMAYLETDNQSDWKQAIIEADNLLDEMVAAMPYHGENLGERLKNVEPSDFLTLEDAWEAHKVRNQVAHQSDLSLTRREARRVIELYERVFREFNFI
jgi:hypothetical protein